MTKQEFYKKVNWERYPKYVFSQIKEGKPEKDCSAIICTASDKMFLAKYENGKWQKACFTSTDGYSTYSFGASQSINYVDITEDVIYWTDGKAEDYSRPQHEP